MATDRRKKAVEAECHHLDSALEEIRQKTSALQEEKRRFVAASEVPAARPKDESDTKESRVRGSLEEHFCLGHPVLHTTKTFPISPYPFSRPRQEGGVYYNQLEYKSKCEYTRNFEGAIVVFRTPKTYMPARLHTILDIDHCIPSQ